MKSEVELTCTWRPNCYPEQRSDTRGESDGYDLLSWKPSALAGLLNRLSNKTMPENAFSSRESSKAIHFSKANKHTRA